MSWVTNARFEHFRYGAAPSTADIITTHDRLVDINARHVVYSDTAANVSFHTAAHQILLT
ncbi:MAG: hypothetical protein AAFR90_13575 [Pseudomonadota bacterium]